MGYEPEWDDGDGLTAVYLKGGGVEESAVEESFEFCFIEWVGGFVDCRHGGDGTITKDPADLTDAHEAEISIDHGVTRCNIFFEQTILSYLDALASCSPKHSANLLCFAACHIHQSYGHSRSNKFCKHVALEPSLVVKHFGNVRTRHDILFGPPPSSLCQYQMEY